LKKPAIASTTVLTIFLRVSHTVVQAVLTPSQTVVAAFVNGVNARWIISMASVTIFFALSHAFDQSPDIAAVISWITFLTISQTVLIFGPIVVFQISANQFRTAQQSA
jgi:hypothetical protein